MDAGTTLTGTPFRVERMLAVGGMAEVYLARETLIGGVERRVVIKRLQPQYRDEDELVTMFFDESRVGALVQHPNVVQVHRVLQSGRDCLIVMEYVPGPSLRDLLVAATMPGRTLPPTHAAAIALIVAEAMECVHNSTDADGRPLGIVHRDLNPSNILVSRAGAIKIIDFGIARGENRVYETATGMVKGTPGYMAPEQLDASGCTDARTDIFALGVVLYEAFVGRQPFATRDLLELPSLVREGRYTPPSVARPGIPVGVSALISRSLHPDPVRRPRSMGEVAAELIAYLAACRFVPTASRIAELVARLAPNEEEQPPCVAARRVRAPDASSTRPEDRGDPADTLVKRRR